MNLKAFGTSFLHWVDFIYIFLLFIYRTYFCARDLFMYNNFFIGFVSMVFHRGSFIGGPSSFFLFKMSQSNIISNNFLYSWFIGVFHRGGLSSGVFHRGSSIIFSIKLSQSNIISNYFFTGGSLRVLHRGSIIGGPSTISDKGESI